MYPAIVIPTALMDNDTYQISDIGYDYVSGAGTTFSNTSSDSVIRSVLVNYGGSSFIPAGSYRVYYGNALNTSNNNTTKSFWVGNGKTP
jgi:hypothetical protein